MRTIFNFGNTNVSYGEKLGGYSGSSNTGICLLAKRPVIFNAVWEGALASYRLSCQVNYEYSSHFDRCTGVNVPELGLQNA
jgi:hypothetical protein